jgi:phosphoribosylformylglycinamidine synthase subunit PurL
MKPEPAVTKELAVAHGLSEEEYIRIVGILGREPSYTELGVYSVMWSEHCSYKNSIAEVKKLPRKGGRLLVQAGEENAGLVDIGEGLAVAFKIESHNHPSAVEPYQGAATGVGGILRDIFTMGARPVAALNSLRFGDPDLPRTKYLVKGIVKGIGDYGNSFGVPTVAGEIYFDSCFNENPLVNAMAVGIVKHAEIARGAANGPGNFVMIVGSSTGRDGIHGATFASVEISEESESKRPSVQVGDPFTEKLLLEATLEAIKAGLIVGIQDMGAAGISCSTSEMSARAGTGMLINLDKVPVRETEMTPYEIMLSESQERMLVVARPENESKVREIFAKWDLRCETIGIVTSDGVLRVDYRGKRVAEIPSQTLVLGGEAPVYIRERKRPEYLDTLHSLDPATLSEPKNYNDCLENLLASPNICSRRWVFTQYDSSVRTNTVVGGHGDAAVIRLKGTRKGLSMKTDGNPRYVYLDPYVGAMIAVAESARNVVCTGATPLAITNCLNYGNPYKPDMYWLFAESIRGISDACKALGTPVTGGNVSFYNENPAGAIYPTPVIGMIGEIPDIDRCCTADFKNSGDAILLIGKNGTHIGGSEYLSWQYGLVRGTPPQLDLELEKRVQSACLELIQAGLVSSAHDVSDGGLAVCLAESAIYSFDTGKKLGAEVRLQADGREDFLLFGEDQSRIVITVNQDKVGAVTERLKRSGVAWKEIGKVIPGMLRINNSISVHVERISDIYNGALGRRVGGD